MATPVTEVVKVNWKQVFPWLALFRTLGLALHVRQILVGVLAAGLIALGHWLLLGRIQQRTFSGSVADLGLVSWPWAPIVDLVWPVLASESPSILDGGSPAPSWWATVRTVLLLIWAGIVGGLAGGILVRRAASEFCREESLSLISAGRFVWKRGFDYLSAPGLPLIIVLGLGLMLIIAGWLARVLPGGIYLLSATWAISLALGLAMAVLAIAVLLGWPMMIAAISINGGDGFDALSRGFGFVLDRSRYYLWCLSIMTVHGSVVFILIWGLFYAGDHFTVTSVALGLGSNPIGKLPSTLPPGLFARLIMLLLTGFAYSFFWSNITVTYLVLRKSVDNAELDDMYTEGGPPESDDLQALLNPQLAPPPTLLPIIDLPR